MTFLQGYLFGRPMPMKEFVSQLAGQGAEAGKKPATGSLVFYNRWLRACRARARHRR